MISPVQALLAGALTLAVSGVMLVAQPFSEPTTTPPGAEGLGSGEIDSFEGFIRYGFETDGNTTELLENGVEIVRGQRWTIPNATTSDPRFGGTIQNNWNWDVYHTGEGYSLWAGGWQIENEDGGWVERPQYTFSFPDETYPVVTTVFDGTGGYEGLTAIVEVREEVRESGFHLRGVITDGQLPPVPSRLQDGTSE